MSSLTRKCRLVPPEEFRCVWMSAGILSYQLCDRLFDCDRCPVDAAMSRRSPPPAQEAVEPGDAPLPAGCPPEACRYSRNHWWVREGDGPGLRLGIESGLAAALLSVREIVFCSARQEVQRGQACVWIVMDGGTLPLESPVDGTVKAVNGRLLEKPHLLCGEPYGLGWLIELEAAGGLSGLMGSEEAAMSYAEDRDRFLSSLAGAIQGKHGSIGPTLADGGEQLQNFLQMLGPARYFSLVRRSFLRMRR